MRQPPRNTTINLKPIAHLYGGSKAYERAKADGLTKLDFEPWLIARTAEFKNWFGDWESAASYRFLESGSIFELTGTEFAHAEGSVLDRVDRYYADHWKSVITVKGIGRVSLDRRAIENSLSHGQSRYRIMSFAAVPHILEKGRIVHPEPMRGSLEGTAYHIAAPICIKGENFVGSVLVKADANGCRLFTHQVFVKEKLQFPRQEYGAVAATLAGKRSVRGSGAMRKVLCEIYSVNLNSVSKEVAPKAGEPLPEAINLFLTLMRAQGVAVSSPESPSPYRTLRTELQDVIYLSKQARRVLRSAASGEVKTQVLTSLEEGIKSVSGPGITAIPLKRILLAFAMRQCSESHLLKAATEHDRAVARSRELLRGKSQGVGRSLGIDL